MCRINRLNCTDNPTYMPSLDRTFYHSPSLAIHTHYFGLVNIIEYSTAVALKFSKNLTYEKIDKGGGLGHNLTRY